MIATRTLLTACLHNYAEADAEQPIQRHAGKRYADQVINRRSTEGLRARAHEYATESGDQEDGAMYG